MINPIKIQIIKVSDHDYLSYLSLKSSLDQLVTYSLPHSLCIEFSDKRELMIQQAKNLKKKRGPRTASITIGGHISGGIGRPSI